MPKITVVPFGGLGNRMRVLNSVFYLNKDIGQVPITLVWLIKAELGASFGSLFQSAGFSYNLLSGFKYRLFLKLVKHIFICRYPRLYKFVFSFFYDLILFDDDILEMSKSAKYTIIARAKNVLIVTCYSFYPFPDFNNFTPNSEIIKRVNMLKIPANTVGIHIRRTDHAVIIKESGLTKFEEKIKEQKAFDSSINFYLATDDSEVKDYFRKLIGDSLITQETELLRSSENGVQGAFIDVLALSRCSKIICNLKSSFAEMALLIGNKKECIEV